MPHMPQAVLAGRVCGIPGWKQKGSRSGLRHTAAILALLYFAAAWLSTLEANPHQNTGEKESSISCPIEFTTMAWFHTLTLTNAPLCLGLWYVLL